MVVGLREGRPAALLLSVWRGRSKWRPAGPPGPSYRPRLTPTWLLRLLQVADTACHHLRPPPTLPPSPSPSHPPKLDTSRQVASRAWHQLLSTAGRCMLIMQPGRSIWGSNTAFRWRWRRGHRLADPRPWGRHDMDVTSRPSPPPRRAFLWHFVTWPPWRRRWWPVGLVGCQRDTRGTQAGFRIGICWSVLFHK